MQTKRKYECFIVLSFCFALISCGSSSLGVKEQQLPLSDEWPGGTVTEWESKEGLEEHWFRDPHARETRGYESDYGSYEEVMDGPGMANHAGMGAGQDGLEGGEIDDNENFSDFLEYSEAALEAFGGDLMVRWLEVQQRHIIKVVDENHKSVSDAYVEFYRNDELITTARSHSDGRVAFYPLAYGVQADVFTAKGSHGDHRGEIEFAATVQSADLMLNGQQPPPTSCSVDVAFLIDTTGSMGEEIDRIKETVSSIATRISLDDARPHLRLALVDYRDIGDEYVTHSVNFTHEVEAFQRAINRLQAGGGGDMPESMNKALFEAMRRLDWRKERATRLVFIIADAPAHYYENEAYTYDQAMLDAMVMGVTFYPIASGGSDPMAEFQFRQLAQFTLGNFTFITEGNGSPEGSGGSDYHVSPEDFIVQNLDDLIVRLAQHEISNACSYH